MSAVDLGEVFNNPDRWGHSYRAALLVLDTLHKTIPARLDDVTVDWDCLEEISAPWSSTERLRVRLARSLYDGDLSDAADCLDDANFAALLHALVEARGR